MSTQRIEVIVVGNIEKSGPIAIEEGQTITEALLGIMEDKTYSYRLNGVTANGDEQVVGGDRVTAVPEEFKVKAGV